MQNKSKLQKSKNKDQWDPVKDIINPTLATFKEFFKIASLLHLMLEESEFNLMIEES